MTSCHPQALYFPVLPRSTPGPTSHSNSKAVAVEHTKAARTIPPLTGQQLHKWFQQPCGCQGQVFVTDSSVASWLDKEAFMLCILYMFPCDVARPAGPGGRTPMTWFGRDGSRIIVPITIVGLRACSAEMKWGTS